MNRIRTAGIAAGIAMVLGSGVAMTPVPDPVSRSLPETSVAETAQPAIAGRRTQAPGAVASQTATRASADAVLASAGIGTAHRPGMPGAAETPRSPSAQDEGSTDSPIRLPAAARAKMSGPVAAMAMRGGTQPAEVIVSYAEHPELFENDRIAALGGEVVRRYGVLDLMAVRVPSGSLVELAVEDSVDRLSLDDAVRSLGSEKGTANVPAAGTVNGVYTGHDVGVAIIDTGVSKHSDLGDNVLQYSFLNGQFPVPTISNGSISDYNADQRKDLYGHGTHVAGILSGNGADSDQQYTGTAQSAKLVALQVLDGNGSGSTSDVIAALDWLVQYAGYFDIQVVNMSLGQGVTESIDTDPMVAAVEALWDQGIVVVVAAGNYGRSGDATIMSPANSRKVITVGSLTDNGTGNDVSDDYVSTFSSRGPTLGDLVLKPDLVAPGNRLVASIPKNAKLRGDLPGRVVQCTSDDCEDDYFELSGTSMAAPMVTATAALMLHKDPTLTPATIKARLMRSARKIDAAPIDAGAGVLDVEAALNDTGVVTGQALSPLMVPDAENDGVFIEDTAVLWGSDLWGSGHLWSDGFTWASGYGWTDGVEANGYLWTDGGSVDANGYGWTDGVVANGYGWTDGVVANGYGWTDGTVAQGLLDTDSAAPQLLDDEPVGD